MREVRRTRVQSWKACPTGELTSGSDSEQSLLNLEQQLGSSSTPWILTHCKRGSEEEASR
jgi:hypothetical protein